MLELTKQEATEFFAEFYGGEHHIPGFEPKPFGLGWSIAHDRGCLSSFDFTELTRLVIMAHEKCIRVEVSAIKANTIRIAIHKRAREGKMNERHPTIETAIESYRASLAKERF